MDAEQGNTQTNLINSGMRIKYYRYLTYGVGLACILPFLANLLGWRFGLPYQYLNLVTLSKLSPIEQIAIVQKSLLGANFYALLEWMAGLFAVVTMLFAVSYYNSTKQFLAIWMVLGLLTSALWDGMSSLQSIQYMASINSLQISLVLTWFLGSACVALVIVVPAIWHLIRPRKEMMLSSQVMILLVVKVAAIAAILMIAANYYDIISLLPKKFILINDVITKVPVVLFILGMFIYGFIHQKEATVLSYTMLVWCFISVLHEVVLLFAPTDLFGNSMYIASYLKITAYVFVLVVLIKEYHRTHQNSIYDIGSAISRYQSEILRYTQELQRSNQELDDFCYIVSHDLKEPLRGIHNYAGFLQQDYADKLDDNAKRMVDSISRLSKRMESLLEALLYYSQVGRVELAIQTTDINETLDKVLETLEPMLREKKVELKIPRTFPTITCDHIRAAEIFRNLITNAIKYNDKGQKWIEVGWLDKLKDGKVVFYVKDNGIGIKPENFENIFKIFKRLHSQEQYGGGTGSGLTIIKKILDRLNNTIWLESEYGKGTTFFFTLGE